MTEEKSEDWKRGYRAGRAAARREMSPHALEIDTTFKKADAIFRRWQKMSAKADRCPKKGPTHANLTRDGDTCPKCNYTYTECLY